MNFQLYDMAFYYNVQTLKHGKLVIYLSVHTFLIVIRHVVCDHCAEV